MAKALEKNGVPVKTDFYEGFPHVSFLPSSFDFRFYVPWGCMEADLA